MANNVKRYGFRPVGNRWGQDYKPEIGYLASGYAGQDTNAAACGVGAGDVLKKVNDGTLALAAAADAFAYVCVGVIQYWDGTVIRSGSAVPNASGVFGTNYERETQILVVPAAGVVFEVDCDDAVTATTYAAYKTLIHNNVNHINTGDTSLLRASPQLDISTANTTNTLQWRIVGISPTAENQDYAGSNVKLLVTANISQLAAGTAGTTTGV